MTSLYIPFTELKINHKDGQAILYENLVQSGPAYKLIVHESPAWREIEDRTFWLGTLEIISNEKAESYKQIVSKFFAPITEATRYIVINGKEYPTTNLTTDLRRALSYILIAHVYGARICEGDILDCKPWVSEHLRRNREVFSEEAISRAEFAENLIMGYQKDTIPTLSVNRDPRIFTDVMDLLGKERVKMLSEANYHFGVIDAKKDMLLRDVRQLVTQIVKNEWFPYVTQGAGLALSYYKNFDSMKGILPLLGHIGGKILGKFDFRKYAPPIQSTRLFGLQTAQGVGIFSYRPFNYEVSFFIPQKKSALQ